MTFLKRFRLFVFARGHDLTNFATWAAIAPGATTTAAAAEIAGNSDLAPIRLGLSGHE